MRIHRHQFYTNNNHFHWIIKEYPCNCFCNWGWCWCRIISPQMIHTQTLRPDLEAKGGKPMMKSPTWRTKFFIQMIYPWIVGSKKSLGSQGNLSFQTNPYYIYTHIFTPMNSWISPKGWDIANLETDEITGVSIWKNRLPTT